MSFAVTEEGIDETRGKPVGAVVALPNTAQERAERAALWWMAQGDPTMVGGLSAEDLTLPKHAMALRALRALAEREEAVTVAALVAGMEREGAPLAYRVGEWAEKLFAAAPDGTPGDILALLQSATAARLATRELLAAASSVKASGVEGAARKLSVAAAAVADTRWPAPVPLDAGVAPALPDMTGWGVVGRLVTELAAAFQVPADMPAVMALGVIAAALGGKCVVRARSAWVEPVNLFLAVAMPPASRKSAVVREVTRPILEWERREAARCSDAVEETASALRVAEANLRRAEEDAGRAKDDEARLKAEDWRRQCVAAVTTARRNQVLSPRCVTDDATPEALTSLLADHGGRFAMISAEGGGVFDMIAGRYSNSANMDVYLKGHAGDTIRVDRKGRAAEYVPAPALTVCVATQPDTFRTLASKPELRGRGLPARFLYALPVSTVGFREVDPPPPDPLVLDAWSDLVHELLGLDLAVAEDGALRPHQLVLEPEATALLNEVSDVIEARLRPGADLAELADWGGKAVGAVVRIAGLLHVVAVLGAGGSPWREPVGFDSMARAGELVLGYFVPHAKAAFQAMGDTQELVGARKLLAWCSKQRKGEITARDALRALNRNGDRRTVVDPVVAVLLAHGWLREAPQGEGPRGRGRPTERFLVNPAAFALSTEAA